LPQALGRWLKALVAVLLVAAIYQAADWRAVGRAVVSLQPAWLAAALLLFVPQTLLSAWRWRTLVGDLCRVPLAEALRQTLAASALNLVVPSKLGDLSKAVMLPLAADQKKRAAWRAAVEKGLDVAALAALLLVGLAGCGWLEVAGLLLVIATLAATLHVFVTARSARTAQTWLVVATQSLALWTLHLAQIDGFLKSAGVFSAGDATLARVPLAIFAGLLPVSLWGLGTRDAALIFLFRGEALPATMAVVGMLTALRYLVPGAAGILFLTGWLRRATGAAPPAAATPDGAPQRIESTAWPCPGARIDTPQLPPAPAQTRPSLARGVR
jgi:hypothetical protein